MGMTAIKFESEKAKFTAPPERTPLQSGGEIISVKEHETVLFVDKFAELVVQLKKIPHGRVTIFMQDGNPVRIEKDLKGDYYFGIESIKL